MKKILIVEDEIAYLKLLDEQLTKVSYKVLKAENGKEGLEVIKKERPDLILLDIRMPVMDGMTMLLQLRKEERDGKVTVNKQIKVVMLTNLEPDQKITSKILDGKPSCYFVKSDIKINELLLKISELLAN